MYKKVVSTVVVALMLLTFGCSVTSPQTGADPTSPTGQIATDVLRVVISEDPTTLDMSKVSLVQDRIIAHNIYNGLLRFRPGHYSEIELDLAKDYEVSDDGMSYTFYLHEGVQWHDGFGELTSSDVKFTIEYHRNPDNQSRELSNFEIVESVETPDPYTVIVNLRMPTLSFLPALAWQSGFIMSQKAFEERGEQFGAKPVGTGPFQLTEWTPGKQVTLSAFKDHFRGAPALSAIELVLIKEHMVALMALEKGEVDVAPVSQLAAYNMAKNKPDVIALHEAPSAWNHFVWVNTKKAPLDNQDLRQAIQYAINQEEIASALSGLVVANPSVLNPVVFGWTDDLPNARFDLDKARELAESAGYVKGSSPVLKLVYGPAYLYEELSLMIKDQLSEIVDVEVVPVDRAIFANHLDGDDWHLGVWSVTRVDSDQSTIPFFHSNGPNNRSKWANPALDQVMEQIRTELDVDERVRLFHEFQRIVSEDVPVIPGTTMKSIIASRPNVHGLLAHPLPGLMDFSNVTIGN